MLWDPVGDVRGLRAKQRGRTALAIADTAMELFEKRGYDETSLEEIAAATSVSVSTMHRYYATKDNLLLEHPRLRPAAMASTFLALDAGLPIGRAVSEATLGFLESADAARPFLRRLRDCIDTVPTASARLWTYWQQETTALRTAIGTRATSREDDLLADLLTGHAMTITIAALDKARRDQRQSARAVGADLLQGLRSSVLDMG
jgi:AcrR family transcriptional regulator